MCRTSMVEGNLEFTFAQELWRCQDGGYTPKANKPQSLLFEGSAAQFLVSYPGDRLISEKVLKLPATRLERDLRFAPTSFGECVPLALPRLLSDYKILD